MVDEVSVLNVSSEGEIYSILSKYLDDDFVYEPNAGVTFDNFPSLTIKLDGEGFNATITPTVMKVFIEFQKAIYKSYAQARYNTDNIGRLTKQEKKDLELVVKVEEGSSIFNIDGQAILEKMAVSMAGVVTGEQVVLITLGMGVLFFGANSLKVYLNNKKQSRSEEITSEIELRRLEQVSNLSEQETKRMQIIADIKDKEPIVNLVQNYSDDLKEDMIKTFSEVSEFEFSGVKVAREVARELTKSKRNSSIVTRLDGLFRILSVDSSNPSMFKVKIRNTANNQEFLSIVQDETFESSYKTIIQKAEWNRTPVRLNINAKIAGDDIREAVIIRAERRPEV